MIEELKNRNSGLDFLRSICLLMVVLQHAFMFTDLYFPQFRIFWFVSFAALDVFFVLSGFLIANIIYTKYKINNEFKLSAIIDFYKRRWYKTVPMYFICIAIFYLLSKWNIYYANDLSWKHIFFLQNVFEANFHFMPHTYSLAIEEWFYLSFPIILFLFIHLFKLKKLKPFYFTIIIIILIGILSRLIINSVGIMQWDSEIRKSIISRFDATIYGVLFYFINLKFKEIIRKKRILLLLIGIGIYVTSTWFLKEKISLFFNNVIYYSIIPFSLSLLLPFFKYFKVPSLINSFTTIQSLSSYTIYLIHLPVFYIIYKYVTIDSAFVSLILILFSIILVYLIGVFLYKKIEKPIMDLRDK